MPPPNFVVPCSITIKLGVLIEFDTFSPKYPKSFENEVTAELWRHLLYPLKFRTSLFLDVFGWNLAEGTNSRSWFLLWSHILYWRPISSRYWPFLAFLPPKAPSTFFNNRVAMVTIKLYLTWGLSWPKSPKMFLTTVPKCLGGGSWHLVTFNINLCVIKKLFLVP